MASTFRSFISRRHTSEDRDRNARRRMVGARPAPLSGLRRAVVFRDAAAGQSDRPAPRAGGGPLPVPADDELRAAGGGRVRAASGARLESDADYLCDDGRRDPDVRGNDGLAQPCVEGRPDAVADELSGSARLDTRRVEPGQGHRDEQSRQGRGALSALPRRRPDLRAGLLFAGAALPQPRQSA